MSALNDREQMVRLILRAKALETMIDLPGEVGVEVREVVQRGNVCVAVIATPADLFVEQTAKIMRADEPVLPRTDCEKDLVKALFSLGASPSNRFVRERIEERMGKLRLGPHGSSTIAVALSTLVKRGVLVNDHDRRGYGLLIRITDM